MEGIIDMDRDAEKRIDDFLTRAGYFTLSTVDGDEARGRPLGLHMLTDAGICFGVGDFKNVYRQLMANPSAEITACCGSEWMRYHGKAVFLDRPDLAERALEGAPGLRAIYNEETGHRMMIFRLEEAKAEFIGLMTVTESYSD